MNRDQMNINQLNRDRLSSLEPHQRLEQPSITDILKEDPLSALCPDWRRLQFTDRKRWSRRYLLPLIRVTCLVLGWTILAFKRLIPLQLGSQRLLNWLSRIFMKYFVSPEAQEMLYRHFSVENALVHFVVQNSDASDIQSLTLKPACPEQLGDTAGTNATLMHDTIMLNLFADLGKSKDADIKSQRQWEDINFGALHLPKFKIYKNNAGRLFNIDFESCLYITVFVLTICFTSKQIENAVGSLFLDSSLMKCLANLTGDNSFRFWATPAPGERFRIPLDPASYLYRHILVHEFAYYQLQLLKAN